jgi:hypothetical protein
MFTECIQAYVELEALELATDGPEEASGPTETVKVQDTDQARWHDQVQPREHSGNIGHFTISRWLNVRYIIRI